MNWLIQNYSFIFLLYRSRHSITSLTYNFSCSFSNDRVHLIIIISSICRHFNKLHVMYLSILSAC
uniref:Uncharacterized protein n=1 Tax=Amphimedon queenslandica TaxID=400682 RepID=A0A1X7UVX5_AMPQE